MTVSEVGRIAIFCSRGVEPLGSAQLAVCSNQAARFDLAVAEQQGPTYA